MIAHPSFLSPQVVIVHPSAAGPWPVKTVVAVKVASSQLDALLDGFFSHRFDAFAAMHT